MPDWSRYMDFQTLKLKAEDPSARQHVLTVKLKSKVSHSAQPSQELLQQPSLALHTPRQPTASPNHSRPTSPKVTQGNVRLDDSRSMTNFHRSLYCRQNSHPEPSGTFCSVVAVVTPLRNKLNANICLWFAGRNPDSSVLNNLRDVLEIEFPSPATHEKSVCHTDCGICYSYRLEDAIPDQVCNDPRCGQPFHQACLYEWLRALPSSRQSFNLVFGECPYCSKPITVKMAAQKS
uniref:E3 ubiquitin-protein ligase FANCL n=1 Tax=Fundulus heteroclitus TaxID=8078 RepID=A0A3Q2SUF3_FUNHE